MTTVSRVSRRGLSRLVTAAVAVALVGGTAGVAAAHTSGAQVAAAKKPSASAPVFPLGAVAKKGDAFYYYEADGKGGLKPRQTSGAKFTGVTQATWVDRDADGRQDGNYYVEHGDLKFIGLAGHARNVVPDFGHFNDIILSPGNLAGSRQSDLLARSKSGHLSLYTVKEDGTFSGQTRIGGKEWAQYTDITGRGDLTGDGKTDIVAKDRDGVLWLHKGTGKADKPFEARTRIGGGWNKYTKVFSNGDLNGDGRSDLLAVDGKGALWLYKGTGKAAAPFTSPVKIGNSGWNQYRLVY
ncbi:FG-GAP repeat domain-containing protein [Streptomyces sp. NPDC021100]|uniref:FG-GAP repeat domain-containing protein n=1 Tax=Streptomyces sp. NPDC021100 TaxID=3365114 RepID=UPI0037ABD309